MATGLLNAIFVRSEKINVSVVRGANFDLNETEDITTTVGANEVPIFYIYRVYSVGANSAVDVDVQMYNGVDATSTFRVVDSTDGVLEFNDYNATPFNAASNNLPMILYGSEGDNLRVQHTGGISSATVNMRFHIVMHIYNAP